MTRAATVTQAEIVRRLRAAKQVGMRVAEIKPDGTVVFAEVATPEETEQSTSYAQAVSRRIEDARHDTPKVRLPNRR